MHPVKLTMTDPDTSTNSQYVDLLLLAQPLRLTIHPGNSNNWYRNGLLIDTVGVAARAQLLQGNGMGGGGGGAPAPSAPHWQQQVYNPNSTGPMWYNGGPIPDK